MTPIIFRDVNFHIYKISSDYIITKYDETVCVDDIIYHSTNGYDYIPLETFDGSIKMYRMDMVIYNSFHPDTLMHHPHFNIIHLDGNIKNNTITNLAYKDDTEEWQTVKYPCWIPTNKYLISSWGNVYSCSRNKQLVAPLDLHGYPRLSVYTSDKRIRNRFVHQLVADHFIPNPNPECFNQINHIDGDPTNNHVSNLEWSDYKINGIHAYLLGLNEHISSIAIDVVDEIVSKLINMNGSIKAVYDSFNHKQYPQITYHVISKIKYNKGFYNNPKSKFYKKDITFDYCMNSKLSTADIDMVIEMLLSDAYNGSVTAVYNAIDHDRYPYISRGIINLIKCRNKVYYRSDSKYDLKSINFPRK